MNNELLEKLGIITAEESRILNGDLQVQKDIYSVHKTGFIINSKKLLNKNELITVRTHTRFIDFPAHRHDYIEMMYVCQGKIEHIINGESLVINQGECLLLNTHSVHEIKQASVDDIAINFIIHPDFFENVGSGMSQNNPVRIFLHNLIRSNESQGEYFHFKVSDIFEIQNLIENVIYSLVNHSSPNIIITQMSMNLLFMYFSENLLRIVKIKDKLYHELLVDAVIDYISTNYKSAELRIIAQMLNQSDSNLSRLIKKQTGKTYKELLMSIRFYKALELLETTVLSIDTIIESVGYENKSYFHRLFKERINSTPNQYRQNYLNTNKDPI